MGAPPSNQHRIELLEKGIGELRISLTDQINTAVKTASQELQKKLNGSIGEFIGVTHSEDG